MIQYITMSGKDTELLLPLFERNGWILPHPQLSSIVLASENGDIVGFGTVQLVFHGEPIWVHPRYRGAGVAEGLAERMAKIMQGAHAKNWVCVASNPFAEELCAKFGMTEVQGKLFVKEETAVQ